MGTFYDELGNEVEAFDKKEVDSKVADAKKEVSEQYKDTISKKEVEEKYVSKEEYDSVNEKLTKRSDEYNSLKEKSKKDADRLKQIDSDRKELFEKKRDELINGAAGDDKEYAEKLREQFDRLNGENEDAANVEATVKEAHVLAEAALGRDVTEFSINSVAGEAPNSGANNTDPDKPTEGEVKFLTRFL